MICQNHVAPARGRTILEVFKYCFYSFTAYHFLDKYMKYMHNIAINTTLPLIICLENCCGANETNYSFAFKILEVED